MNKKLLFLIGGGVLLLGAAGVLIARSLSGGTDQPEEPGRKKQVLESYNEIPVSERPYLRLTPTADGRSVEITAVEVKKAAESMEYELEYQSGSLLQGVFGSLEIGTLPATSKQLLGSCSAGGACTYHEDVTGGKLTTRYEGAAPYALRQEWRYIENTENETTFSSRDAKFQLSAEELARTPYAIILNSPGYPDNPVGSVVSDPYAVALTGSAPETATVTIRANQTGNLTIVGWNGTEWVALDTTTEDQTATAADAPLMEAYLVVSQ